MPCGELKRLRASAHAASAARQIMPEQRRLARGPASIFCLVFFSLPVILLFALLSEPALFLTGYIFGRSTGHRPLLLE